MTMKVHSFFPRQTENPVFPVIARPCYYKSFGQFDRQYNGYHGCTQTHVAGNAGKRRRSVFLRLDVSIMDISEGSPVKYLLQRAIW